MKTIYFIRHGYALHNKLFHIMGKNVYKQFRDTHLLYEGIEQAKYLGKTWDKINDVDLVVTSPCSRTLETTMHIFKNRIEKHLCNYNSSFPVIAKDFLIEYPMGTDICNRRKDVTDLKFFYPYIDFSEINDDVLTWTTKKETLEELNGRIQDMIQWIKQRDEKTIAIVSHSSFISQYKDNAINDETNELLHCHPYKIET